MQGVMISVFQVVEVDYVLDVIATFQHIPPPTHHHHHHHHHHQQQQQHETQSPID
jgi:hypothetical protein